MPGPKPLVLIILDGWGYRAETKANAIATARKPTYDRLLKLGQALRLAQVAALERKSKNRPDVGAASDAHRRAVTEAVHRFDRARGLRTELAVERPGLGRPQ